MHFPASLQADFQGTAAAFNNSLSNEPLLILAALVTVYIVLGVLYESFIHPITILSTLPSAGVGALLALILFRQDLNVVGIIGIILLIGIVKKNGILIVDFALEAERKSGKRPTEAIYEASLLRFRPIMMTTMAALLGGLPLALGQVWARSCAARWASPWLADCWSARFSRSIPRRSSTSSSTGWAPRSPDAVCRTAHAQGPADLATERA